MRWLRKVALILSMLLTAGINLHAEETSLLLTEEEQLWVKQHPVIKVANELDCPPLIIPSMANP